MTPEMLAGPEAQPQPTGSRVPLIAMLLAIGIVPVNFGVCMMMWSKSKDGMWIVLFSLLALGQFIAGLVALVAGIRHKVKYGSGGVPSAILGALAAIGAPLGWFGGIAITALGSGMGGAWGRPLRVRGRQLHPELRVGSDWTRGERPDGSAVDPATRRALQALWLHDAQKEHASVPAFSRVSWMLAAAGAPAELLEWSHRAALEEIEHTRLCFALAAGYGGKCHTVEPMPDLLLGGLDVKGNALVVLATESLGDGCQLEDYNADVAAACAVACEEPVTRRVLELIAREERTHADFSWAVVEWLLQRDFATVAPALEAALGKLDGYPRPTAVSQDKLELVASADAAALRRHGRLPDTEWARIWSERLQKTHQRLRIALEAHGGGARAVYAGAAQVLTRPLPDRSTHG